MKTNLLLLILFIYNISNGQLPAGAYGQFEFTNGSLANIAVNGGPDLSGNFSPGTDRNGNIGDAAGNTNTLSGHTLGASNVNEMTLAFWIRNGSSNNFRERIIQIYGTGGYGFKLEMNASGLYLDAKASNGSVSQVLTSRSSIINNQWRHIVVRSKEINAGQALEINVFIDGVLDANLTGTLNPAGTNAINSFLQSAQMVVNPGNFYLGSIDDIYLYKTALTDAQISDIYNYSPAAGPVIIRYVNAAATGNNQGTSWINAFTDLQSALAAASAGDEIWIAGGTYKPATSSRSTYFDISRSNLKIYGGFAGTEASITDRVLGTNETILSGDIQGNDVNLTGYAANYGNATRNTDNSYRIINITAAGENLLLDGLTISDAHTNINTTTIGGAILKESSVANLTIRNCIIKDNVSRNFSAGLYANYGLPNTTGPRGSLIIDKCQFINNMSRGGSGAYIIVTSNTDIDVLVSNSLFINNTTDDLDSTLLAESGSGLWFRASGNNTDASLKVYNNTFVNNIDKGTNNTILDDRFRTSLAINQIGNFSNNIANGEVANCIFWNNTGLGDATSTTGLSRAISDVTGNPITSLNVYNSLDPLNFTEGSITNATGTVITNPLFTDPLDDYTLQSGSPAINSGDNNYVIGSTDLLGNQRIFNNTVDMGAYESLSSTSMQRTLTLNATNGSITPNVAPTNGTYNDGTVVELTAVPDAGFVFDGWSGDLTGATNPVSLTMDADKTVTATFSATASIDDLNKFEFILSPNPTNGLLQIQTSVIIEEIKIYNLVGQEVAIFKTKNINVSNLKSGFYLLKIKDDKGRIGLRRVIKK